MKKGFLFFAVLLGLYSNFSYSQTIFNPDFPPIKESTAFKQFVKRPPSELSKLVYLIDRFSEAKVKINYDGFFYDAPFSAKVAKWFLARRYRSQSAEEWIMLWCNKSVPGGSLIWVIDSQENTKLAREVLFEELKTLHAVLIENDAIPEPSLPSPSP